MRKNVKIYDNPLFAERFRTLMGKTNTNLQDIALLTGCAVSTASTWRRGRLPRNYETLEKIAELFKVDAEYLAGRSTDIFSNESDSSTEKKLHDILNKKFTDILRKSLDNKSNLLLIKETLDKLDEKI